MAIARSEPFRDQVCPLGVCDGSGWILGPEDVARPCECRAQRLRKASTRGVASVIPPRYRGVSLDRPPISDMARDLQTKMAFGHVRDYVESLDENLEAGRGLWLFGDTGTGKTTLAMLISKTALESGRSVAIHIDDLGAEKRSDWVLEQLYALINERYEAQRSILITTNLKVEELEEQIGARTVSRLSQMCDLVELQGHDRRWDPRAA
jgi:DNA replication protein DnaC